MAQQLGVQLTGIGAVLVYTAIVTYLILKVVGALVGLRVSEEEETQGLDVIAHNESGYDL
jgi:Amt family ammonium transporter